MNKKTGFEQVDGKFGKAIKFSHTGRFWAQAQARSEYSQPPITVECWAKIDNVRNDNVLVSNEFWDSCDHWELFSAASTGFLSVMSHGLLPKTVCSNVNVADGKWHYLAMVLEAEKPTIYHLTLMQIWAAASS